MKCRINAQLPRLLARAENLACSIGNRKLPVPLNELAKELKVKRIDFRPLLVAGCLEVVNDGFNVYVNSDKSRAPTYLSWLKDLKYECRLPGRLRFTIAHELGHTFFFDHETSPPQDLLETDSAAESDFLERLCNSIAAELLLPQQVVRRCAVGLDFTDPDSVRLLCNEAAVSPEALVIKARSNSDWFHDAGALIALEDSAVGWRVNAFALHGMPNVFGEIKRGTPFRSYFERANFCLNGGSKSYLTTIINFNTQASMGFQRVEVRCEKTFSERDSILVTVRALGNPWFV